MRKIMPVTLRWHSLFAMVSPFTLRERELPAFRLYRMRARSRAMVDGVML